MTSTPSTPAFRKGDIVRYRADLRADAAHHQALRGLWVSDRWRPVTLLTQAEHDELSRSPAYQGLDDAGEPRLLPRAKSVDWSPSDIYIVIRARARAPREWGGWRTQYCLVLYTVTGRELFIRREALELAE